MSNKCSVIEDRKNMLDISADDFESPVNFKKFKSSTNKHVPANECKVKKYSKKRQVTLHQMVKQNLKYSDVNPEHLQMALALSKSISDGQIDDADVGSTWDYDDNKNDKKPTLLEFGFKYNKIKMNSEKKIIKNGKDTLKTNKKSKFRFITPILYLRTEEDRESLIQSKISLILTENVQENSCRHQALPQIMSEELMKINCCDCSIFCLNYKLNEYSRSFSVPDLITVENKAKSGYLLREWKNIPLRDHSPEIIKTCKQKLNRLENEIQFHSDENTRDCENQVGGSIIKELNLKKTENFASIIHEKVDCSDSNIYEDKITNTEFTKNMYMISSPDLFEDQKSIILAHTSILENSSDKQKRSWKKLFSEDGPSETHFLPEHTVSNNSCFPKLLASSVENNVSENNICYLYNMNSQVSETIMISSSSDEEDLKNNVLNNSLLEKHFEDIEDTSLSYNLSNVGNKYILSVDNVTKEYDDNKSKLNLVDNINDLDKNVSLPSSDKYKKLLEGNINMESTSKEAYKVHSRNESISIYSTGTEDDFSIINVKTNNPKYLMKNSKYEQIHKCNSDGIKIDKQIYNDYILDKEENCKASSINKSIKSTNISFNNDNFINRNNLKEHAFTSDLINISVPSDFDNCEKDINLLQPISESYKECTSLNVTEHIEEILAQSYSPFISTNISDDEGTTYQNKQTEYCGRISKCNSSTDLQNPSKERNQTFKGNSDLQSFNNLCSPTLNICSSDEENYLNNIETNERNYIFEDIEVMNDKQTISHSHRTPLKKYASFSESGTATTSTFGRYKSESDITPKNEFFVKTENITPMINYNQLDTPSIVKELSKYGLKPLKRKRGVNLLQHIYEATHPIVESKGENSDTYNKKLNKWKKNRGENVSQDLDPISNNQFKKCHPIEPWMETFSESDLIFERQRSSKISGCQIPLQIVWHNFLVQNPELRESILLYNPLHVNIISNMFKEQGFKFHVQDLITFLDRKCITIKI